MTLRNVHLHLRFCIRPPQDHLTLSIAPQDSSTYIPFSESVPLLLTTEAYDCYSAPVAVSEWQ